MAEPGDGAEDILDQQVEEDGDNNQNPREDIDVDETLKSNRDERGDFRNEFEQASEDVVDNIETGVGDEANSMVSMVKDALGLGKEMKDDQDQIEASADKLREMAGARKAHYETEFGGREEEVSIDGERVEEDYSSFRSEFSLALDETLPMAWERDQLVTQDKNRSRVKSAKGAQDDPTVHDEMEETGDLWLFGEEQAELAKDRADNSIEDVLDEVNIEGQALELQDRKETYEEVDSIVETAIENVQEADDEISIDDMEEALEEAAEEYDLDIETNLDEEQAKKLQEAGADYIDEVAEITGTEDQIVSSVTTNIREFYDEEDVDPIEAAQHLRATVADAFERQAERFSTAVNAVEEIEGDLQDTLESYDTFTTKAEDLTNVDGVGESVADQLSDADVDTVFDLATASQRRLQRMTDSRNTRGDNAENLRDAAQTYIETELAHELGLEELTEQMEDTVQAGDMTSIQYAIREQAEAAYDSVDTVQRYVNSLMENTLPESTDVEFEDGNYSAEEALKLASGEREEAYEELGLNPTDLDEIEFIEDTQDVIYEE
ncbi:MAG: helix-hairpin-helix domain-containing protein [Candidatus Nanohalobium sp.]